MPKMRQHRLFQLMTRASLAGVVALCGCASNPTWVKPGATEADLSHDRYTCLKESQITHEGNYKMNSEGQFSSQHYNIDSRLFNLCMGDAGWTKK
jgi:hypothetical protein